jgi:hypothetical protein
VNQILAGLLVGLVLGAIDGATAWLYPEARSMMGGIMMGSSVKGMVVGLLCGWFARKVHSTGLGIAPGSALGRSRRDHRVSDAEEDGSWRLAFGC